LVGDHPRVADSLNNMAIVYQQQGKYEEALEMFTKAYHIYLKVLGPDHPSTRLMDRKRLVSKRFHEDTLDAAMRAQTVD